MEKMTADTVIDFWFEEIKPEAWFKKDLAFDQLIRDRFMATYQAVIQCECSHWREASQGRLAEIIVIDQFSRNMFRDDPLSFKYDSLALALAQEAIYHKYHEELPVQKKTFLYMPFMHSESRQIHQKAVELFSESGMESAYEYELKHKRIIDRFGRYPHRNKILGRISTQEELDFLKGPDSSF